jgi:hypothetical protein
MALSWLSSLAGSLSGHRRSSSERAPFDEVWCRDLMTYADGKFAEKLLEAVERDKAAASVTSRRLYQVDPSEEWTQPQLVVEVDTTLNTEQAFRMMERLDQATRELEKRFELRPLSGLVDIHWRPNAG